MGATLICLPNVSYLPLQSPLRNYTFLLIILSGSEDARFPVLLHQLLRGYSGKVAAFRGQRIIYSMQLVQLTESLAYLAKRQVFANTEAIIFENLSLKKCLTLWLVAKSYLR